VLLVPQGMAYALLAGIPPIYGLYGGLVPLFIYALLGTSRQLSIGPVAVSALLVLAGISQIAEPNTTEYISLVILTGLLVGIFQLVAGVVGLGFLVNFLSHPVIAGFTSAAAIIIAVSQLKYLLGIQIPRFTDMTDTLGYAFQHIGETNIPSVILCICGIVLMLVLKKINRNIPGALIAAVLGILFVKYLHLEQHGIEIVKDVPEGLPAFDIPNWNWEDIKRVLPTVFTVTTIGIVESISIAKVLEAKHTDYKIDANQELKAIGISKIIGSFFQALPTSGSFTRSAVNNEAGAKSGVASIFAALLIGLTLLFFTPLFYHLPTAILASIVLLSVKSLFEYQEAIELWKTHRSDFYMMLATFIITLICTHFRNVERFPGANQIEDTVIIRFDSQLYFANSVYFREVIEETVSSHPTPLSKVILDASVISDIDSSGLKALEEIYYYLKEKNIQLILAGAIGPVRDRLHKSGLMDAIGKQHQYLYVRDAVAAYQDRQTKEEDFWTQHAIQVNED